MSTSKKLALLITALVLILLLGGYLGTSFYFSSHFFPNTTIGKMDVSQMTAQDLTDKNTKTAEDYLLTVHDRAGGKSHLRGMDFSYSYVHSGEENRLLSEQNAFSWPLELGRDHPLELTASYSYDKDALQKKIFTLPLFDEDKRQEPENASIVRGEDGTYQVAPSKAGNAPLEEDVASVLTAAVESGITDYTLTDACYKAPEITEDSPEITAAMKKIDKLQRSTVTYKIDGVNEGLTSGDIADMITVSPKLKVSTDESRIDRYVQKLASTYNTFGDVRTFTPAKGKKTIKIGGGDYGWVISKAGEKKQLLKDLKGGKPVTREPVYEQRAAKSGTDDIGDTYVELDLTNQHLYYFENGKKKLESDIVSGNINNGNGSPDGIFKIVYKQSPAVLVGENYESSVTYFMPFAYNVGIHDADWRSSFGGQIYKTSGSHGCINVPKETAKKLYKLLKVGTPVVAYYREKVKLTSKSNQIANAYSYADTGKNNE